MHGLKEIVAMNVQHGGRRISEKIILAKAENLLHLAGCDDSTVDYAAGINDLLFDLGLESKILDIHELLRKTLEGADCDVEVLNGIWFIRDSQGFSWEMTFTAREEGEHDGL